MSYAQADHRSATGELLLRGLFSSGRPRFEIRSRPIHICCGKDLLTGKSWQCPGLAKPFHFGIIETRKHEGPLSQDGGPLLSRREVRRGTLIAGLRRELLPGLSLVHGRFDLVGKDAQMIGEAAK